MKTVSFVIQSLVLVSFISIMSCGRNTTRIDVSACSKEGGSCVTLCKNWADAQVPASTRYAGAYFCSSGQVNAVYDQVGEVQVLSPGSYSSASTGLPCSFTVATGCVVTEQ